ncbi:MAG: phosphatase PAP2 family protein [Candidatus Flexifilum sp.]
MIHSDLAKNDRISEQRMILRRKSTALDAAVTPAAVSDIEPALLSDPTAPDDVESTWARLISDVLSPPVVWGAVGALVAFTVSSNSADGVLWAAIYGALVCLLPALYIVWMVKRGQITDIHIRERTQRFKPFAVSLAGALGAWVLLRSIGAAPLMPLFALFSFVQILGMFIITLWWQISMHAMSITAAVLLTGALIGPLAGIALLPLIPVVGAARVRLNRHTTAQVIAGALLGGVFTLLMLAIARA